MEAVSFPDAEGAVIVYLNAAFAFRSDAAKAGTRVPETRGRFVRVQRAGGSRDLAHDNPSIIFECWDVDSVKAERLANLTRALIGALDGDAIRFRSEIGGVAYFPDPRTDLPRYQFTAAFRTHGEAI